MQARSFLYRGFGSENKQILDFYLVFLLEYFRMWIDFFALQLFAFATQLAPGTAAAADGGGILENVE